MPGLMMNDRAQLDGPRSKIGKKARDLVSMLTVQSCLMIGITLNL